MPSPSHWSAVTIPKVLSLRSTLPSLFSVFAEASAIVPRAHIEGRIVRV